MDLMWRPKELYNTKTGLILLLTFAAGCLTYFQEITNFSLSVDEEYAFFSWPGESIHWWYALGRWGSGLLDSIFRIFPYTPAFTMFLMIFFLSLAAVLAGSYFFSSVYSVILFSLIFVTCPQFAYQAEFAQQADTVAFGFLLSIVAGILLSEATFKKENISFKVALGIFAYCFSLGIYQSFISIPIMIFLFSGVMAMERGDICSVKESIFLGLRFCVVTGVSIVLYFLITKFFRYAMHAPMPEYLNGTIYWSHQPFGTALNNTLVIIGQTWKGRYFAGDALFVLNIFVILFVFFRAAEKVSSIFFYALFIIFSTFGPFLIAIALGGVQGPRVLLGIGLLSAFYCAYALKDFSPKFQKILCCAGALVFVYYSASVVNTLFFSDYMARKIDESAANRLFASIQSKYSDFDITKDKLGFVGKLNIENHWRLKKSDTFGVSEFNFADGDPQRMVRFIALFAGVNIALPDDLAAKTAEVRRLPAWPASGSIIKLGNNYYVHLGE